MTVSNEKSKVGVTATGVAAQVLAITFERIEATDGSDIEVLLRDQASPPVLSTMPPANYTVDNGADTVTIDTITDDAVKTVLSGDTYIIRRKLTFAQPTDYVGSGRFPADAHETALDRQMLVLQQNREILQRAIVFPNHVNFDQDSLEFDTTVPFPIADEFIRINPTADGFILNTTTEVITGGSHTVLSDIGTNTHSQIDTHIANTANPHSTTVTQAISSDGGTDITVAQLETLSDGSNADALHAHDHDALTNFLADEHIAHSGVQIITPSANALSGGGDLTASRTLDVDIAGLTAEASPDGTADFVMIEDTSLGLKRKVLINNLPTAGGGETNTASNTGTDGVGVFDAKNSLDLEFRNVAPASSKISVVLNTKDIDLDVVEANLTLDSIGGTLGIAKGGTGQTTAAAALTALSPLTTKGDLIAFSTLEARLPIGADDFVLTADAAEATGMKWAATAAGSPLTTKGDVFGFSTVDARLPIGTNDQVLTADSTESLGIKWAAVSAGVLSEDEVQLTGFTAMGSTNTTIARFTTVEVNTGSDITLTQSSTLGDIITIDTKAIYAISLSASSSSSGSLFCISRNQTLLSNSNPPVAERLTGWVSNDFGVFTGHSNAWCGVLDATDIIRVCCNSNQTGGQNAFWRLGLVKVADI